MRSPMPSIDARPSSSSTTASRSSPSSAAGCTRCSSGADRVRVLATSREALGARSERLTALAPLEPAPPGRCSRCTSQGSAATWRRYADGATIDGICARLDRSRSALELARGSGQAPAPGRDPPSVSEDASRCPGTPADGPAARTSRGGRLELRACSTTVNVVSSNACRCSADGATTAAATEVCHAAGVDGDQVERLLYRLVDKSLVVADRSGAQTVPDAADPVRLCRGPIGRAWRRPGGPRPHARGSPARRDRGVRCHTTGQSSQRWRTSTSPHADAITWAVANEPVLALATVRLVGRLLVRGMRVSEGWGLLQSALQAAGRQDLACEPSASGGGPCSRPCSRTRRPRPSRRRGARPRTRVRRPTPARTRVHHVGARGGVRRGRSLGTMGSGVVVALRCGRRCRRRGARELRRGCRGAGGRRHARADAGLRCRDRTVRAARRPPGTRARRQPPRRAGVPSRRHRPVRRHARSAARARAHRRAPGVIAGATARLGHARLIQGDLDEAERRARAALVVERRGVHAGDRRLCAANRRPRQPRGRACPEGRDQLRAPIEVFEHGAGGLGVGLAAMVWIDLSASLLDDGDADAARDSPLRRP